MPAVSVLLPVRNALPHLGPSLASLWRQTLVDFEVIAVEDGSTDGSGEALERAAAHEPRLRVVHTAPRGLPAALNTALARAQAPLLARHDADDLSHRLRLELQCRFLDQNPRAAVVGSRVRLFPAARVGAGMRRWIEWHNSLLDHETMANEMLIDSTLVHGTATMRRSWLERIGGWAERGWAEDLDLWLRLLEAGAELRPEVLYGWRQRPDSATHSDPRYHRDRFLDLKLAALDRGLLRGAEGLTLVGVGRSLERWREPLGRTRRVRIVSAGRPPARIREVVYPPVVLVFGSAPARRRWRSALVSSGMTERGSFIFVA